MAVAFLREFDPGDDRSTTNYDAVSGRVGVDQDPPDGLITHTAGFSDDGTFRIFDVWESREQAERFEEERLVPAMQEVMGDGGAQPPARREAYDLHNSVVPDR